jgi:hypothetical protein
MRPLIVAGIVSSFVACSNGSSCLPALPGAASCGAGVFIDATAGDPICLSSGGEPLCRGDYDAICYVCTGSVFADNCLIRDKTGATSECVHGCSHC